MPAAGDINEAFRTGHFQLADSLINSKLSDPELPVKDRYHLYYQKDLMARIMLDFNKTEEMILEELAPYFPDLPYDRIIEWVNKKQLEMKLINGEKRYFNYAVNNLFRLNEEARSVRTGVEGPKADPIKEFCLEHTKNVIDECRSKGIHLADRKKLILTYNVSVDADAVPEGEVIRCWLPYPREFNERQSDIRFISSLPSDHIIACNDRMQRSIYLEQAARKGEPALFEVKFSYQVHAQWFDLHPEDIGEYRKEDDVYLEFTRERSPHIQFTPEIKKLTDSLTNDLVNPLDIAERIYTWIHENISWASALEYSTIENIPGYVLENRHGDCGMQTLLFMTMASYKGIPVKWQSGWMLHPGKVNLHDWCEVYYEGPGWVPLDQSFGLQETDDELLRKFYLTGIDGYRLIVNDDYGCELYPVKIYPRSEPLDFQRGELEWKGGNLYFNRWDYSMKVEYIEE